VQAVERATDHGHHLGRSDIAMMRMSRLHARCLTEQEIE